MNHSLLVVLIASGIGYGTPLLFASLGELLAERSGVLNLGVEGMMLMGAVTGFWTVQRLHAGAGVALAAAVAIAALARYNPLSVCLVAFLLGGLLNAGYTLQGADFPSGLVGVLQGLILFSALGGELLVRYRIRVSRRQRTDAAPAPEAT